MEEMVSADALLTDLIADGPIAPNAEDEPATDTPLDVQVAHFSPLAASAPPAAEPNSLDLLLDVPLHITVELGQARLPVRDLLALQTGSVIELDRTAGQPVDILVNDRLIAHGEVVVIDDHFGVRITDIVPATKPLEPA